MINVEEVMSNQLGADIAADIDFEIISTMLISMGWTKIKIHNFVILEDIKKWVDQNCKGRVHFRNDCWLFEDERDAINFTLKWSN